MNIIYPNKKEDWFPVEVYGKDFTGCLNNMFHFIIKNNLQKWFSQFEPDPDKGFMFSSETILINSDLKIATFLLNFMIIFLKLETFISISNSEFILIGFMNLII